jgi:hypothetical protein
MPADANESYSTAHGGQQQDNLNITMKNEGRLELI